MKLKLFLVLAVAITVISLLVSCGGEVETTAPDVVETTEPAVTEPVETEPEETEPPHTHEYTVTSTVRGTCVEDGYEVYSCSCGLSYKNLIAAEHSYSQVISTDGKYVKNICKLCGDYKIVRKQNYLFNLTFDGYTDIKKATESQPNLDFYTISSADKTKGTAEIKSDVDGAYMYIKEANYCVWDNTNSITSKKIVASMDVMFEKYANESFNLFSISYQQTNGNMVYNNGIVIVAPDGELYAYGQKKALGVKLVDKGYNNITMVYDPVTGLADLYLNEKLVASGIKYYVMPKDISRSYIRYFDRKPSYSALADNLKVYLADTPEFVVPDGIQFPN